MGKKPKKTLGPGNTRVALDLPSGLWARVKHHAIDSKTTAREIVITALERYLPRRKSSTQ